MSSRNWQPSCLSLNVLTLFIHPYLGFSLFFFNSTFWRYMYFVINIVVTTYILKWRRVLIFSYSVFLQKSTMTKVLTTTHFSIEIQFSKPFVLFLLFSCHRTHGTLYLLSFEAVRNVYGSLGWRHGIKSFHQVFIFWFHQLLNCLFKSLFSITPKKQQKIDFPHKGPVKLKVCPCHGPLTRYSKLRALYALGMPGTFSPPPLVSDPDMHHGTCVTQVSWCMPGSPTSGFLWIRWRGKRSRHSRPMRNPQCWVSGKRPMASSCKL